MATTRILWVEDDPDVVRSLRPVLQAQGWQVDTASSAAAGRAAAAATKPDLIIMDIIMDGEHGFTAVEELKDDPDLAAIPVIIYTSVTHRWRETTATRRDGLVTPADDFVDKTDGPAALLEAIRRQVARGRGE